METKVKEKKHKQAHKQQKKLPLRSDSFLYSIL